MYSKSKSMRSLERLPWRSLGRWWIVGLGFYVVGLTVLYLFTDSLRMPLMASTLLSAEVTLVLRFLVNDRWVFRHRRPRWSRLWQFHVASAGGGTVWWVVSNTLPRFGVHYLLAATAGNACAVVFGMTTNFLWVWRQGSEKRAGSQPEECTHATEGT
jgi:putative flippase GtrA